MLVNVMLSQYGVVVFLALIISKNIGVFKKVLPLFFTTGAYNLGGSPAPTVAKIKNSAYLNLADGSRDDYLGEFSIRFVHVSIFIQCLIIQP